MVLLNASKMARSAGREINRTNVCGGVKKAGIVSSIGWWLPSNHLQIRTQQRTPMFCFVSKTVPTQRIGYRATLG